MSTNKKEDGEKYIGNVRKASQTKEGARFLRDIIKGVCEKHGYPYKVIGKPYFQCLCGGKKVSELPDDSLAVLQLIDLREDMFMRYHVFQALQATNAVHFIDEDVSAEFLHDLGAAVFGSPNDHDTYKEGLFGSIDRKTPMEDNRVVDASVYKGNLVVVAVDDSKSEHEKGYYSNVVFTAEDTDIIATAMTEHGVDFSGKADLMSGSLTTKKGDEYDV